MSGVRRKSGFRLMMHGYPACQPVCTFVFGTSLCHEVLRFSVPVAALPRLWGIMFTIDLALLWAMKSLLVIILSNLGFMLMVVTNKDVRTWDEPKKFLVWLSSGWEGDYVLADTIEFTNQTVLFIKENKVRKTYLLEEFLKWNKLSIKPVEIT